MRWRSVVVITLAVLFTVLVLQNTEVIDFQLLAWRVRLSRIILPLFALVVGFLVGLLISYRGRRRGQSIRLHRSREQGD
jgi:uncharacterized integral membrane protein